MLFRSAGVSPYTSACAFAETCVFGKQSVEPFHCGRLSPAPLLPKLRGQFAEFLNQRSPERLRLLASSTCVSFSTVDPLAFLGSAAHRFVIKRTRPCGTGYSNSPTVIHKTSLSLRVRGRNINRLSIGYAFRPDLRDRLTLGGFTFPRKP